MNINALIAIESSINGIFSAGMDFPPTWREFIGVISMITLPARVRSAGSVEMSPGKLTAGMLTNCMPVSLPAMINAGSVQMGFRADSFDPIVYVRPQTFGAVVGVANAVLSLAKLAGVGFVMNGISIRRKVGLDRHTALSVSESVSKRNVEFIAGVLLVFIDRILSTLLTSIRIIF